MEVTQPLVGAGGARACHDARTVAHVLSLIEALVVVCAEILESCREDIAEPLVAVEFPLSVELARYTIIVSVVVRHAARVGGARRLHLSMDEVAVGLHQFVGIVAVVDAKRGMEGEVSYRCELQLLRGLEPLDFLLMVLHGLGLRHKRLHLLKLIGRCRIDIGREVALRPIGCRIGEIGCCSTLGEPQSGIVALVAIAVAFVVLGHETEGVGVFEHGVEFHGRAETNIIFLLLIAIVDDGTRILAHAGAERVA